MNEKADATAGSRLKKVFVGPKGIRAGWRLLLFHAIVLGLFAGLFFLVKATYGDLSQGAFTVDKLIAMEAMYLLSTLVGLTVMSKIERRRIADYGIPLRTLFGARFWAGAGWGVTAIGAIAIVVLLTGGMQVAGLNAGSAVARAALLWALGTLGVSLFEELFFRGYFLSALSDGIGAMPAAILQALYFGFVLHYLEKDNETLLDGVNVSLIAFAMCLSVLRSGDVRWAAGLHWTFNFTSFFVLGSPNTAFGGPVEHHLLQSSFAGSDWLSGGATGLEASIVATMVFAALIWIVEWRLGGRRARAASGRLAAA